MREASSRWNFTGDLFTVFFNSLYVIQSCLEFIPNSKPCRAHDFTIKINDMKSNI